MLLTDALHAYFGICGLSLMNKEDLQMICAELSVSQRSASRLADIHRSWSLLQQCPQSDFFLDQHLSFLQTRVVTLLEQTATDDDDDISRYLATLLHNFITFHCAVCHCVFFSAVYLYTLKLFYGYICVFCLCLYHLICVYLVFRPVVRFDSLGHFSGSKFGVRKVCWFLLLLQKSLRFALFRSELAAALL